MRLILLLSLTALTAGKPESVLENPEGRARHALSRIEHPVMRVEVEGRRADLRKRLTGSLGHGLLPWPPDLRATVTGTVRR
jgi:hypothetical protein